MDTWIGANGLHVSVGHVTEFFKIGNFRRRKNTMANGGKLFEKYNANDIVTDVGDDVIRTAAGT